MRRLTSALALTASLATAMSLGVGSASATRLTVPMWQKDPSATASQGQNRIPVSENPTNPLKGGTWGVYHGDQDGVWPAYEAASGETKALLAKVALQPRVRWYHSGMSISKVTDKLHEEIAQETADDPDALVQIAWFRLWPHGEGARNRALSGAQQADYKAAVDAAVAAIGDTRTAIVLEPDLALTAPPMRSGVMSTADPGVRQSLTAYAAEKFSALPRTSVYLDAGDADWLSQSKALSVLENSGIRYARGFALGATHYSSVAMNVDYGTDLVTSLAAAGYGEKHFVIDTADNGRAFTFPEYYAKHPRGNFDNAEPCTTTSELRCDTLGHAPTWDTAVDDLGLTETEQERAGTYVDGYLWFGRPWLVDQAAPFSLTRTLQVARSTPYDQANITGG
ncbi:MAG: glycoside hydrolase family 6 protein [Nocardioides sp.]|uniref:glycoside hydrolase family 6 protein n=1 Tax=Nocardioides sp. TaxID=35761 RepID=UPI0039E4EF9F